MYCTPLPCSLRIVVPQSRTNKPPCHISQSDVLHGQPPQPKPNLVGWGLAAATTHGDLRCGIPVRVMLRGGHGRLHHGSMLRETERGKASVEGQAKTARRRDEDA
jgi:hypothetical protein